LNVLHAYFLSQVEIRNETGFRHLHEDSPFYHEDWILPCRLVNRASQIATINVTAGFFNTLMMRFVFRTCDFQVSLERRMVRSQKSRFLSLPKNIRKNKHLCRYGTNQQRNRNLERNEEYH
jgi:hypothetical protein